MAPTTAQAIGTMPQAPLTGVEVLLGRGLRKRQQWKHWFEFPDFANTKEASKQATCNSGMLQAARVAVGPLLLDVFLSALLVVSVASAVSVCSTALAASTVSTSQLTFNTSDARL
mmetsp:Transcript_38475/g.73868  ORF Transcript_38475/g.73868 Transcript_38475/m.73868 type:complete len:115 (-) Transcript_38475:222-566(-)